MLPEHGHPQSEELVRALQHDLEQPAGMRAAVVGQMELQDVLEKHGRNALTLGVGETVGVQRHQDARHDADDSHSRPQSEDPDSVPVGGFGPARGGVGEQVDRLAEQDGVEKRHGGQGQVSQGQRDGQPAHRFQKTENPTVNGNQCVNVHESTLHRLKVDCQLTYYHFSVVSHDCRLEPSGIRGDTTLLRFSTAVRKPKPFP